MDYLLIGGSVLLVIAGLASFKRWGWYSREAFAAIALSIISTLILIQATFSFELVEFMARPNWLFSDPFMYALFATMLVLIVVGFLVKKGKLSILGSTALYIPTFGALWSTMWQFGLYPMALLWTPIYDFCPEILRLGNIVLLPHLFFPSNYRGGLGDLIYNSWLYVIVILGIAILFLGTTTWLYGFC